MTNGFFIFFRRQINDKAVANFIRWFWNCVVFDRKEFSIFFATDVLNRMNETKEREKEKERFNTESWRQVIIFFSFFFFFFSVLVSYM